MSKRRRIGTGMVAYALAMSCSVTAQAQPKSRDAETSPGIFELQDDTISASFDLRELEHLVITDRLHHAQISVPEPFAILLRDGRVYSARNVRMDGEVAAHELAANPQASRLAERVRGKGVDVSLESADHSLHIIWSIALRDGSNYIRQVFTITAKSGDVPIERVQLIDATLDDAHVVGSVDGSPIVAVNWFLGFEHPMSHAKVTAGRATSWIDRDLPLRAGQSVTYSSVIGVARTGQMRRDFLAYLERERAHPYRTFLHYNCWYDLARGNDYDAASAVDRISAFGRELTEKRGVKLDSFLFDDGWDNHSSLWKFNAGFPDGFTPL
ncbi:MAG: enterotoxin, partial [Candidatus Korobacteraceae bacterium]